MGRRSAQMDADQMGIVSRGGMGRRFAQMDADQMGIVTRGGMGRRGFAPQMDADQMGSDVSPLHAPTLTLSSGKLVATTDYSALAGCDAAIICVPTLLNKTRDPDVHCEALQTRRMWKRRQYLTEGASYGIISVRDI